MQSSIYQFSYKIHIQINSIFAFEEKLMLDCLKVRLHMHYD